MNNTSQTKLENENTESLDVPNLEGLSSEKAADLLKQYGKNSLPEEKTSIVLTLLRKMWGPVPWMLEVAVILEIVLGKYLEAGIIGALVVINAIMSTVQENNAQNALKLLKQKLTINVRTLRDGTWKMLPSSEIVPGDVVYLRMGDLVPADVALASGQIMVDQSSLTGESLPVDVSQPAPAYAGTTVVRGEAAATVTATGIHTRFGNTAELVRLAKTTGELERIVFLIARYLIILDSIMVIAVLIYAVISKEPFSVLLPFALILLIASVPVALPATFTVATALGAFDLAKKGVLVTRLSAIEEAASMQVLCTDKTGTLTENKLEVADIIPFPPYTLMDVIKFGAMASDAATQDPLDKAILAKASIEKIENGYVKTRTKFVPFDPAIKRSEASYVINSQTLTVVKGAPQVIISLDKHLDGKIPDAEESLASKGLRVLAVAVDEGQGFHLAGLIAFQDPPRSDSASLIQRLKDLGLRIIMVTGDTLSTGRAIAQKVGLGVQACLGSSIAANQKDASTDCDVYGEVLPEDKFKLIQKYQSSGMVVGMTGDGVNDAPALKQAEVGVAVSSATDVAKAAASLVLTSPGLSNIVAAIETSRQIYQRMLTYTLNKISKTIQIVFFMSIGLILFHTFVTTPVLMVLLLFTNDFVTMSISTDRVRPSPKPNRWNVRAVVLGAVILAIPILALSVSIFIYAHDFLQLPLANLQTLLFVMLVYSGQGTIYLVRERSHFWHSRPSKWMLIGSLADIIVVGLLATQGILMASIPVILVAEVLGVIALYLILLDFVKVFVFSKLQLL